MKLKIITNSLTDVTVAAATFNARTGSLHTWNSTEDVGMNLLTVAPPMEGVIQSACRQFTVSLQEEYWTLKLPVGYVAPSKFG